MSHVQPAGRKEHHRSGVLAFRSCRSARSISQWTEDDFIRFANNGITTSGYRITQQISITSTTADKRSGNATVSEITSEALKNGVKLAEELAAISRPNPEAMPALPAQNYPS